MVCVPCIVIPFVLWFFHKYIQPYISKMWNPWKKVEEKKGDGGGDSAATTPLLKCPLRTSEKNGAVPNGHTTEVTSGGDKKTD